MRDGVTRLERDGHVVVSNRCAVIPQLGAGMSPVVVGLGVTGRQLQGSAEVLLRAAVVAQLLMEQPPRGQRGSVVPGWPRCLC